MFSIPKYIRYLASSIRHPNAIEFIDMGLGIEARYARCHDSWQPHINRCKAVERVALNLLANESTLAILGSGRLIDIDIESIKAKRLKVTCYDADPTAKQFAKRQGFDFRLIEITGTLADWQKNLGSYLKNTPTASIHDIASFLGTRLPFPPAAKLQTYDCIFSLNLLSQIPLHWKFIVQKILEDKTSIRPDNFDYYPEPLQSALLHSMLQLEQQHIELLEKSGSKVIALTTDSEFNFEDSQGGRLTEPAIRIPLPISFKGYHTIFSDTWPWLISPMEKDHTNFSTTHQVLAQVQSK